MTKNGLHWDAYGSAGDTINYHKSKNCETRRKKESIRLRKPIFLQAKLNQVLTRSHCDHIKLLSRQKGENKNQERLRSNGI